MKRFFIFAYVLILSCIMLSGCGDNNYGLSKKDPVQLSIWHRYDGDAADKFSELIKEFNKTAGAEYGIYVTAQAMGSEQSLEDAILNSAAQKPGSHRLPDIFQCSADTAAALTGKLELVNYDDYISEDESLMYVRRFIDAGRIGESGEWLLFAVSQSTDVLVLNKTDWDKFADDTGAQTEDLLTWEGLYATAALYYEWSGGKAFFGHDNFANYMTTGSAQLGRELFHAAKNDTAALVAGKTAMRKLWDCFCAPYIKGYYTQAGIYRSDDMRTGTIIAMVCSASRASYIPSGVVTADGSSYDIECEILPLPNFDGYALYAPLTGSGFATVKSDAKTEYAGTLFLKWLAESGNGLSFAAASGYMPVTLDAVQTDTVEAYLSENPKEDFNELTIDALLTSLTQNSKCVMYTPAEFAQGTTARGILNQSLDWLGAKEKAQGDLTDEEYDNLFDDWYDKVIKQLLECF